MKKFLYTLIALGTLTVFVNMPSGAETDSSIPTPSPSNTLNNKETTTPTPTTQERINHFLKKEKSNISSDFPYRINVFNDGQIDKNSAGVRIAETAKQLFSDTAGLVFYYELYNRSMRVPHWHANAVEVGIVLNGKMRVTIWEGTGEAKIFTVEKYGTWMIPQASVHSLENVGEGQLNFLVSYNSPITADRDFVTAWAALPDDILEKSVGLNANEIAAIKKTTINRLSSFDPSAGPEKVTLYSPFSSNFTTVKPIYQSPLGIIRRVDATTTPAMQAMALQQTIMKPGALRAPHWYTGADTLLFVYKGDAFFTLMNNEGKVYNTMLKAGDLVFIPVGTFHAYLNTGKADLEIYESFNSGKNLAEISLLNGAKQFSVGTLTGATGLSKESASKVVHESMQAPIIPF